MKVIILAAGKGTRLLPLTENKPKTLVEIKGKPILEHIIDSLPEKIDEVIIVIKHFKDQIKDFLGDEFNDKKIYYVEQGEKAGTFGALLSTKHLIQNGERFLVANGDDLHETSEFIDCLNHTRSMAVQKKIMPNYHNTLIDENGNFSGFKPQTEIQKNEGALIATGTYVLDSNIFIHPGVNIGGDEYGLPQTVIALANEFPVKVIETNGWFPINSHEDIEYAKKSLTN